MSKLARKRTSCPDSISHADCLRVFRQCLHVLEPDIKSCQEGGPFITYDTSIGSYDRAGMEKYKLLVRQFLLMNPSGVFTKKLLEKALCALSESNRQFITKNRSSLFAADEAYKIVSMFQGLRSIRKSMSAGSRVPKFIHDQLDLLDTAWEIDDEDKQQQNSPANISDSDKATFDRADAIDARREAFVHVLRPQLGTRRRCVLRRLSSATSSNTAGPRAMVGDVGKVSSPEDIGDVDEAQSETKPPPSKIGKTQGREWQAPLAWWDETSGCAKCLDDGCELTHGRTRDDGGS